MRLFQYIALVIVALIIIAILSRIARRRSKPATSIMWLLLWSAAGTAIWLPELTTTIAHTLGIERGADLVFYCAVLGGLTGFFLVYLQQRKTRRLLTLLVRQLAIDSAKIPPRQDKNHNPPEVSD